MIDYKKCRYSTNFIRFEYTLRSEPQCVDGKNVVVISVRKGKSLYYIKKYGRSAAGCFIRVGTSCRSMTEEQIEQRYIETLSIPRKTMKEELSPRQDLTFNHFQSLLTFKNVHYNKETFEQNYNLRNNDLTLKEKFEKREKTVGVSMTIFNNPIIL